MVTLETEADSVLNIEDIEYALECMEQAIRQKIRKVDVCTRYSSMQYLIILFEPDEKQFQISWNVFSVNIVSSAERKNCFLIMNICQ